jgi:hypothetical protein
MEALAFIISLTILIVFCVMSYNISSLKRLIESVIAGEVGNHRNCIKEAELLLFQGKKDLAADKYLEALFYFRKIKPEGKYEKEKAEITRQKIEKAILDLNREIPA